MNSRECGAVFGLALVALVAQACTRTVGQRPPEAPPPPSERASPPPPPSEHDGRTVLV